MPKVAVAMSGGVDSSVTAALAIDKYGKENVFGITMKLFCYGEAEAGDKACCSLDAISDAVAVCKQLGIPHYVVNLEKEFKEAVIDNFISEYSVGRTPNPCVKCNEVIKFQYLSKKSKEYGAEILATGHYSRILEKSGKKYLAKGLDTKKDQSYFLYNVKEKELDNLWFPLGEYTKTQTREMAEKYALKTAQKTESQDICFVQTTVADFVSERIDLKPGEILNIKGEVVGEHQGLPLYTIGQRKGLGGGFAETMYVIGFNIDKNQLIIGQKKDLEGDTLRVDEMHWINGEPDLARGYSAKIRYNSHLADCSILRDNRASYIVKFKNPQSAITPGQSVVLYDMEVVLGGGIISSTENIL